MLSNQLDMQGRTTRKLLDWVGVSAELTILKSFFSIKAHTVVAVWEALLKSSLGLKHQRAFEVLLEVGFLINRHEWITRRSEWIFSSAVKLPALHVVKRLFSSGASPDNIDFKFQPVIGIAVLDTPLGYAAKALHMEMIEILVANGADVNLQSIRGAEDSIERFFDTPLFTMLSRDFLSEKLNSASSADILFCIHLFLDAGADVDVESRKVRQFRAQHCDSDEQSSCDSQAQDLMVSLGWFQEPNWLTDIAWFEWGGDHEIVQTLMDKSNRARYYITVPGIITQARAGLESLDAYLQSRRLPSSANERISLLEIAISKAASLGCLEAVACLLQFGVDPNVGTLKGVCGEWRPALNALFRRHYHILQILRENGASISFAQIIDLELSRHDFDELLLVELADADILTSGAELVMAFLKHSDQENFTVCAKMCDLLWSKGTPIDIRGDDERDPLHFAIFHGCCLDMCKYLIDRGYKVHCNQSSPTEREPPSTMLRDAIKCAFSESTEDIAEDIAEDIGEVVDFLLAHEANIDLLSQSESLLEAIFGSFYYSTDQHGDLQLDGMSRKRKRLFRIFEKLIDLGISVDAYSTRTNSQAGILRLLIEMNASDTLLFRVIEATTDVDQQGIPLTMAFVHGREAVVERLLSRGARVNHSPSNCGSSVLGRACTHPWSEAMVERLIELGADVNDPPGSGENDMKPLHIAAVNGRINVACLLIKHGAEMNAIYRWEDEFDAERYGTPLDIAALAGKLDMVQLLRDAGGGSAYPGAMGMEGAIGGAEWNGHYSVADFLRDSH